MPARKKPTSRRPAAKKRPAARGGAKRGGARRAPAAPRSPERRAGGGHRLRPDVHPEQVDVHVEVDPGAGPDFTGTVRHRLRTGSRIRAFELHAADLKIRRATVRVGEHGTERRGKVVAKDERETVQVVLDSPVPPGEVTLELHFAGKLRADLRGLYAARSGERAYAFTQLEAADARRFFPCFDEPALKARFQIAVTTAAGNTVLSNQPIERTETLDDGRRRTTFTRTPPLSTYLLALAVGELEASEPVRCGETEIRVWHVPGKGALTGFALEAARECLGRLEKYFALPYPYDKLDLVAVPDFEAGAMENAGAVFFRETLLLTDPATVTFQERKRVAEVICHELAHMWYGDLVTMAWWDDLWLNEAFATWMAFHVVDDWKPEWHMWHDFQHYRSAALTMDALSHTHPIYTHVRTPSEATENFDLITYEKGASVVRMIERFLGQRAFRDGVRRYIRENRESNARAEDLWRALARASGEDVAPVVRAWIEQEGFPMLTVRRAEIGGTPVLRFRQERFRASPLSGGSGGRKDGGRGDAAPTWPIPFVGRLGTPGGNTKTVRALLTKRDDHVNLPVADPTFVYANADEGGFFRPIHAPKELVALAARRAQLRPVERMGLIGHQWAAVRAGAAELPGFLDLALRFADEVDPDVLLALRGPLAQTEERLGRRLPGDGAARLRARVAAAFAPAFAALGWDPHPGEGAGDALRRAALLTLAGEGAEDPALVAEAARRCDRYLADRGTLAPDLADGVVALGARTADAGRYERLLAAATGDGTPQDRRRMLMALGECRDPALAQRTLGLVLGDSVGTQDVAILLTRLLGNPAAREPTWAFMKRRWAALVKRLPPMLVTRPIEALPGLGTREHRRDVEAFFRDHPVATGARTVRQALERFDQDLELEARALPQLEAWLDRLDPLDGSR